MKVYIEWSKFSEDCKVSFGFGAGNDNNLTLNQTLTGWVDNKGISFECFSDMLDTKIGVNEYTKNF